WDAGRLGFLPKTEPVDHESEARSNTIAPAKFAASARLAAEPISKTTPTNPMSMPETAVKPGRWPAGRKVSMSTIQSGTVATKSAARLDVTKCSAQAT